MLLIVSSDFTHYGASFGYTPFAVGEAPELSMELVGSARSADRSGDFSRSVSYAALVGC
jgi:predicted class III extradiol MEMO1 family dioxygenase